VARRHEGTDEALAKIDALLARPGLDPEVYTRLRFDRISYWQRPKIASVHPRNVPAELEQLVKSLEQKLIPFGFAPNERTYRPHITVARKARTFPDQPLARPIDLQWSRFELVDSISSPRGIQYHPLKQ
jgi:2'-5' RNA ligase